MAAIQAGLMRAAAEERIRRVLSFHSRVGEAEAMASGVPAAAATLAEDDPEMYPPVEQVRADRLHSEHSPAHRRQVPEKFASDFVDGISGARTALRVLSSVKVIGAGVDTAECNGMLFADARGSIVDIVHMVGRALRTRPGAGNSPL
ncbi:helicase-related protein [Streptomyces sp. CLV115]|uniref:helicase-related protein n=1 Tax=Streptomyces sp. CLV115 TaxID=3138502 RepID=UPI00313E6DD2